MYKLNTKKFGTHQIVARELRGARKILDIGCNEGYLKIVSKNKEFWGVDFDEKLLWIAQKNGYKKTFLIDLNSYPYNKEIENKFDTLLFIDILEHLVNPEYTLKYFTSNNLKNDGKIIVSLPNVANIFVRLGLLFGSFNYTKAGILDETHLHLYTKKTAKKLIDQSGLTITDRYFSSNLFGLLIRIFPFLGGLLGFNLIYVCMRKR